MAKDVEYEELHAKYLAAVARISELEEQYTRMNEQYTSFNTKTTVRLKNARELCTMILAKDRTEAVLGKSTSWGQESIDELLVRAKRAFTAYSTERTEKIQTLLMEYQKRGQELEFLAEQFEAMQSAAAGAPKTIDQIKAEKQKEADAEEARSKAPIDIKKAAEAGKIDLIVEEDEDTLQDEIDAMTAAAAKASKLFASSIPTTDRGAKMLAAKQAAEKPKAEAYIVDLASFEAECGEAEWTFLRAIGEYGKSKWSDISDYLKQNGIKETNCRNSLKNLGSAQMISKKSVRILSNSSVLFLTPMGKRLYERHFGTKPIQTEAEKIQEEHDNLEHGYGIMMAADLLANNSRFVPDGISTFNRASPIEVKIDGKTYNYIPDIVAQAQDQRRTKTWAEYYEYERGNHTQPDFNAKCDKMVRVSNHMNFIVPNVAVGQSLQQQVEEWISERQPERLKNAMLRIFTIPNLANKEESAVFYNFRNSMAAVRTLLK